MHPGEDSAMFVVIALLPVLVAILLLLVLRWGVCDVGWATLGVTIALVSLVPIFHCMSWQIALSLGEGTATMVTSGVVLLPSLLFSQMQQETGAATLLEQSIAGWVPDCDLQTLLFVLGVGPCIESLCGFGSGAIVILPFLARLHRDRLKAAQLSLLSYLIVAWASLDGGTTLPANLAGVPVGALSMHTALLLFPSALGLSMLTVWISGGSKVLARFWYIALCAECLLMLITSLGSRFLPVDLAGFLAGGCVIAFVLIWGRIGHDGARFPARDHRNVSKAFPLVSALLPYFLLIAGIGTTRLIPFVRYFLQTYGVFAVPAIKLHLVFLYSPGVWLLLAALTHLPLFPLQSTRLVRVQVKTAQQLLPGVLALVSFLATAALMQESGMTALLTKAVTTSMWVWFYRCSADGYTLDTKRRQTATTTDLFDLRMHYATRFGETPPFLARGVSVEEVWEQYNLNGDDPATKYVAPEVTVTAAHPFMGTPVAPFEYVTGLRVTAATTERAFVVPAEQIASNAYSLCADTYRDYSDSPGRCLDT
jgi:L-lactate permease